MNLFLELTEAESGPLFNEYENGIQRNNGIR